MKNSNPYRHTSNIYIRKFQEFSLLVELRKMKAVVSKLHCSSMEEVMVVRRRPHVVNGGGFVVTDCKDKIVFKIDGCGVLGTKGELVLRDGDGNDLLLIHKKVIFLPCEICNATKLPISSQMINISSYHLVNFILLKFRKLVY